LSCSKRVSLIHRKAGEGQSYALKDGQARGNSPSDRKMRKKRGGGKARNRPRECPRTPTEKGRTSICLLKEKEEKKEIWKPITNGGKRKEFSQSTRRNRSDFFSKTGEKEKKEGREDAI